MNRPYAFITKIGTTAIAPALERLYIDLEEIV